MIACYAVAGWELSPGTGSWSVWTARSPQGLTKTLFEWAAVEIHYASILAGTAKTEPDAAETRTCACGASIGRYATWCDDCASRAQAQQQAQRAALQEELSGRWGPWLAGGPRDLLLVLAQSIASHNTTLYCGQWLTTEQLTAWLAAMTDAEIAATLVRWAALTLPMDMDEEKGRDQ